MKEVTALLTGDWHIREDTPICRTDNFWEAQWKKIDFISELQEKYNCPVFHSGDLFNHWKPSPFLLSATIEHLPSQFFTIYGNHDLPQHSIELANKCGINVLEKAGKLTVMNGVHWGTVPEPKIFNSIAGRQILLYHVMTFVGNLPWPGCVDLKSISLLKKYPQYDLILSGHNHKSFVSEYKGRILVNPGSITRQSSDQIDHTPCVYLWSAKDNSVEPVYLPIEENVISREHIEKTQQRDGRINAFVSMLKKDWEAGVSFEENLERMMVENKTKESIKSIIYKALE